MPEGRARRASSAAGCTKSALSGVSWSTPPAVVTGSGRFARWRDALVCHLAESIAEQRTLWALRNETSATVRYPATLTEEAARSTLDALLSGSRRHHLRWLVIDLVLVVITGPLFFFVPGPNVIADYFLLQGDRASDVVARGAPGHGADGVAPGAGSEPRRARGAGRCAARGARIESRRDRRAFESAAALGVLRPRCGAFVLRYHEAVSCRVQASATFHIR